MLLSSTVVAGASTVRAPSRGSLLAGTQTSGAPSAAAPDTSGSRPSWANVASPLASSAAPGTYGAVTGYNPLPQACGDSNPIAVLGAMYQVKLLGSGMVRCDMNWWSVQPFDR